jgi:hypothetical protein
MNENKHYSAKDVSIMRNIVRDMHCVASGLNRTQISVSVVEDQLKTYIMAGVTLSDLRAFRDEKERVTELDWA